MERLIICLVIVAVIRNGHAEKMCQTRDKTKFYCPNDFECQYFNETSNSIEKYCVKSKNELVQNCAINNQSIEALRSDIHQHILRLSHIKVRECNITSVQTIINLSTNLSSIDISYSNFESLNGLNFSQKYMIAFNVSHNQFNELPVWNSISAVDFIEMDFSFNKIQRIESNAFENVFQLIKIHLSNNEISYIADDAFTNLANLEYVNLNNNQFHWVDMFRNNKMMKWLLIVNNPVFNFDCNHFLKMSSISVEITWESIRYFHTNCDGNQFHTYLNSMHDDAVMPAQRDIYCHDQSFQKIQQFIAGRNKIESVAKMLQCFGASLKEMDLSGNFVGKLNTTTFKRFIHLEWLSLSDTILIDFDFDMLKSQTKLERLDLSFNNLKSVRNVSMLEHFHNLSQFIAADSQLPNASEIIKHFRSDINYLDLSGNFIGPINVDSFKRLIHLQTFKLNNTHLVLLDSNPFEPLIRLKSLDISQNDLSKVNFSSMEITLRLLNDFSAARCQIPNAADVIQYFGSSLTDLDLSGNIVNELNLNTFKALVNLKNLYLSNVYLLSFDSIVLKYQTQLRFLNISYNQLKVVNLGALSKSLVKLDLEGNHLINVTNFHRQRFSLLESLAISKNYIPCDYIMDLIQNWNVLKFIGNPMEQIYGVCDQINRTSIPIEMREMSSFSVYMLIIIMPIIIILLVGCICFSILRQIFATEKRDMDNYVIDIRKENSQWPGIDDRSIEHIYEEIEDHIVYDHLMYDTDPMPISASKCHYHNSNILSRQLQHKTNLSNDSINSKNQ